MFTRASLLALGILAVTSPAFGQTLRVALNQDIRSSEPGVSRIGNTDVGMINVVGGAVTYDKGGAVKPLLAESYQISPDGKTYTFKLRKGVKVHNGNSLTSTDVVWNFDRYMNLKTNWYCLNDFNGTNGKVVSSSAPDADTFVLKLKKPDALFLDSMARNDCGRLAIILKADGTWDKPIGTDPFTFGVWKQGQSVQFDAFKLNVSPPGKERDGLVGNRMSIVDQVFFMAIADSATVKVGLASRERELRANKNLAVQVGTTPVRNSFILRTRHPGDSHKQPRKVSDNPEALTLIDKAMATLDPKVRQPIFDELHTMLLNDVPIILTHNRSSCIAHSTNVWSVSRRRSATACGV